MLVEVRPIERKKWHGKKGEETFSQPVVIECLYDPATGKYATGLTDKDRKRLEAVTGYDLSDSFNAAEPHPFWSTSTARIKLPYRTVVFDTTVPLDEIKVKVLKASKFVANSLKEYEEGLFPEATHVIYDENEEVAIKASRIQKKQQAFKLALKMSLDEKVNIIMIMSHKSVRNQSQDYVDVEIDKLIGEHAAEFIEIAKRDKKENYVRASLLEAIHRNILTKEGNAVYYMGDRIGDTFDDAVNYFLDPQNQNLKAAILEKLNS